MAGDRIHDVGKRRSHSARVCPDVGSHQLPRSGTDELHRAVADPDRLLVVEVSEHFPRMFGVEHEHTHSLSLDEIDVLVRTDRQPLNLADSEPTDAERAIAGHAMRFIHDGCTLQTGIGGIPSQIASMVAASGISDLGIHSEMFTTGLMHLMQSGKVSNRTGGAFDGYTHAGTILGGNVTFTMAPPTPTATPV